MYRAAVDSILGLRRLGPAFAVEPCIPSSWPEYHIDWTVGTSRYHIRVVNPDGCCRGVVSSTLDGAPVNASAIPIADDGRTHIVVVVLGDLKTGRQRARSRAAPRAGAVFHPEHLR